MIAGQSTKALYEALGPAGFVRRMHQMLGLRDERGARHLTEAGNPRLVDPDKDTPRIKPTEFSLRDLAESLIGPGWADQWNADVTSRILAMEAAGVSMLEAGTNLVTPTAFANINAFTSVVTGLLEVSVLDGWQNPEYIADQLAPVENTRMFNGRKVIGTSRIGDQAEPRRPGNPTKRAGFSERWVLQPETVENSLSAEVTQEAVYLDLTGEVLQQANSVGDWTAYRKELRVIDAFIGVTNTYSYKGTSYNTFQTASTWDNDVATNELVHWNNIETVFLKFRNMQDQETSTKVRITPTKWLVNLEKMATADMIIGLNQRTEYRDAPGSTSNPQYIRAQAGAPSYMRGLGTPLTSPLVYQRMTDASGLALSASNAGKYWFVWDGTKPPLKYAQNWPLRVQTAAPAQADMIDRGVVLFTKADERGVPMWYEPRRIVRCKP